MMFAESWISDIAVTCGISQRQVSSLKQYPVRNSCPPTYWNIFEGRKRELIACEPASKLSFGSGMSDQADIADKVRYTFIHLDREALWE